MNIRKKSLAALFRRLSQGVESMDEKAFEELIARYQKGEVTKNERALVDSWLQQRESMNPFGDLSEAEKQRVRFRMFQVVSANLRAQTTADVPRTRAIKRIFLYRAAAAILVLAALSFSLWHTKPALRDEKIMMMHSVASLDGMKKIILDDSSIVWLKGNSSILYPERFEREERHVKLAGEALFEVAKDAERPFIVECGGLITKVLGTSFNIKSSQTNTEIVVLTGKVSVSSKEGTKHLVILPNEKAVYDHVLQRIQKVSARESELLAKTSETQYAMQFSATKLSEIIRRIEGKFDVRVSLSEPGLNHCTITADFTDQSLQNTVSMIAQTLKIQYEISNGHVVLSGSPCKDPKSP